MNAKERAKYLMVEFQSIDGSRTSICFEGAKQCALIVVQECIDCSRGRYGDQLSMQYWLNVENEIKNFWEEL
jgi:hypothetical protein